MQIKTKVQDKNATCKVIEVKGLKLADQTVRANKVIKILKILIVTYVRL